MPAITPRPYVLLIPLLALGLAAPICAEETPIGTVDRVTNRVTAETPAVRRDLAAQAPLYLAETVRSYAAARMEAALKDGTTITMGENAVLKIADFRFGPGADDGALSLRVLDGAILFKGGDVEDAPDSTVTIKTTFGILGVRGTTFWAGPLDGGFAVLVLEGEVTVSNVGTTITLGPNEGTTIVSTSSPPRAPVIWPQAKVTRALATIGFDR